MTKDRITDAINDVTHPAHYQHIRLHHLKDEHPQDEKFEVMDIQEGIVNSLNLPPDMSIAIANAIKYICRAPFKEDCAKDLKKAGDECLRAARLAEYHQIKVKESK